MDKVTGQCPQTTTFLKTKESPSGIEPRPFRLPTYRLTARPNRLTRALQPSAEIFIDISFGYRRSAASLVMVSPQSLISFSTVRPRLPVWSPFITKPVSLSASLLPPGAVFVWEAWKHVANVT